MNDLWTGFYHGNVGGLYPKGANNAPAQHLAAGIDIATNQIRPLDAFGNYDPVNGKIVMISVGMSNTTMEFSHFVTLANSDPTKNTRLVIVDGAQSGQDASAWVSPTAQTWRTVNSRLAAAGVTPAQVQVAWVKQARIHPNLLGAFPLHAQILQSNLEAIARNLKTNYPNSKIAYCSSRTRAYTNDPRTLNPEPFAVRIGFLGALDDREPDQWCHELELRPKQRPGGSAVARLGAVPVGGRNEFAIGWLCLALFRFAVRLHPSLQHRRRQSRSGINSVLQNTRDCRALVRKTASSANDLFGERSPDQRVPGSPRRFFCHCQLNRAQHHAVCLDFR